MSTKPDSSQIKHETGTLKDIADASKPLADYTALRAYTGTATTVRITSAGIAGFFTRDADVVTADNGGTVIVDGSGRRWKRVFDGAVSVKWFGAVGDGVADDAAAIQNAITAAADGVLFFPDGDYLVNSQLNVGDVILIGNATITKGNTVAARFMFKLDTGAVLQDLTLRSNGDSAYGGSADNMAGVITLKEAAKNIQIRSVKFIEVGSTYSAISIDNPDAGPLYTANVENVLVDGCRFSGFTRPLYLSCIDFFTFTKNVVEDCRFDAIRTRKNMDYMLFDGNTFKRIGVNPPPDDQTRDVIDTYWSGRSLIFTNNLIDTVSNTGVDIKGLGTDEADVNEETDVNARSHKLIITGNQFKNINRAAVKTGASGDCISISNNVFDTTNLLNTSEAAVEVANPNSVISGNHFINCGRGVFVNNAGSGIVVDGNTFTNSNNVDIRVAGTATVNIINNVFNGYNASYNARAVSGVPALRLDAPSAAVSFFGNFFNKPDSLIMFDAVSCQIRAWASNIITPATRISFADERRYRQATVYHSDLGHNSARAEALLTTYDVGDAVFAYGTSNSVQMVGLDSTGTTLGTATVARQSWTVATGAGFDFASLAVGDWLTFSGGVLGAYKVVAFDSGVGNITVDVAIERAGTGVTVTKRPKKLFSVSLA